MRKFILSCTVIGLILLSACKPSAVAPPASTSIPAETNTSPPLTHLDLWLSIEDDSNAPSITKIEANSVTDLYIWAKAPKGVGGDFTLWATYQHGGKDQLGYTFHAKSNGQPLDCGTWSGEFLNTKGTVILEAYAGDLRLGTFTFSID